MQKLKYLSPTSINKFQENREDFYMDYLADKRRVRPYQTEPMSIGSAFDAYVKNYLYTKIIGKQDQRFDLKTLFDAQVEERNRKWAWEHGAYVFRCYMQTGALADLLRELEGASTEPRFEIEVNGVVNGYREGITKDIGVPLLGKPDLHFINKDAASMILDWKVNGYCSKSNVSPMPGYINCRSFYKSGMPHKEADIVKHKGIYINRATRLENLNKAWATQLYIYAWLCGEEVGSDFIVGIDQVVCKPAGEHPDLRFATHRLRASSDFQFELFRTIQHIWEVCESGHIFYEVSREQSDARCKVLEQVAAHASKDMDDFDRICKD